MRRPITYAELLLILFLLPVGYIGVNHLYEFVSDRITIEIKFKKDKMSSLFGGGNHHQQILRDSCRV